MITCRTSRPYMRGDNLMALSFFSPVFYVGVTGTVTLRERGSLLAVRKSNGEIFKWFAIYELQPVNPEQHILSEGIYAYVTTDRLSGTLDRGTHVQIIKRVDEIDYYDVNVHGLDEVYRVTSIDVTKV